MKHSLLFKTVTVLGAIFLAMFFVIIAVTNVPHDLPSFDLITQLKMWFLITGGTFCLITGVLGIVRRHFESQRSLFAILIAISIPILVIAMFYMGFIITISAPTY